MSKRYYERLAKGSAVSKKEFRSDFGLKILKKFGWEEGKGLGRDLDGQNDCVQISRREQGVGLGGEKAEAENGGAKEWDNWWEGAYNKVAKGTSDSSDSDSDDDVKGPSKSCIKGARVVGGKLARICRQEAGTSVEDPGAKSKSCLENAKCIEMLKKFRVELIAQLEKGIAASKKNAAAVAGEAKKEKKTKKRKAADSNTTEPVADKEVGEKKKKKKEKNV